MLKLIRNKFRQWKEARRFKLLRRQWQVMLPIIEEGSRKIISGHQDTVTIGGQAEREKLLQVGRLGHDYERKLYGHIGRPLTTVLPTVFHPALRNRPPGRAPLTDGKTKTIHPISVTAPSRAKEYKTEH